MMFTATCPICGSSSTNYGMADHMRERHPEVSRCFDMHAPAERARAAAEVISAVRAAGKDEYEGPERMKKMLEAMDRILEENSLRNLSRKDAVQRDDGN
jgi:hypothetical protein